MHAIETFVISCISCWSHFSSFLHCMSFGSSFQCGRAAWMAKGGSSPACCATSTTSKTHGIHQQEKTLLLRQDVRTPRNENKSRQPLPCARIEVQSKEKGAFRTSASVMSFSLRYMMFITEIVELACASRNVFLAEVHASALLATANVIRLLALKRPQTDNNTGLRSKIGM